jgi:hypothetical protein
MLQDIQNQIENYIQEFNLPVSQDLCDKLINILKENHTKMQEMPDIDEKVMKDMKPWYIFLTKNNNVANLSKIVEHIMWQNTHI